MGVHELRSFRSPLLMALQENFDRVHFFIDAAAKPGYVFCTLAGIASGGAFHGARGTSAAGNAGAGRANRWTGLVGVLRAPAQNKPTNANRASRLFLFVLDITRRSLVITMLATWGLHEKPIEIQSCSAGALRQCNPRIAYRRRCARAVGFCSSKSDSREWRKRK